jgi:hypothetical protein
LSERIEHLESAALSRRTRYFKRSLGGQSGSSLPGGAAKLALTAERDFRRQYALLEVARSGVCRPRKPANDAALMRRIDELFSAWPFLGSRRMTQCCAPMACS